MYGDRAERACRGDGAEVKEFVSSSYVTCEVTCSPLRWLRLSLRRCASSIHWVGRPQGQLELEVQGRRTSRRGLEQLLAGCRSASVNHRHGDLSVCLEAEHEEGKEGSMFSVNTLMPPARVRGTAEIWGAVVSISVHNIHCLFQSFPLHTILIFYLK